MNSQTPLGALPHATAAHQADGNWWWCSLVWREGPARPASRARQRGLSRFSRPEVQVPGQQAKPTPPPPQHPPAKSGDSVERLRDRGQSIHRDLQVTFHRDHCPCPGDFNAFHTSADLASRSRAPHLRGQDSPQRQGEHDAGPSQRRWSGQEARTGPVPDGDRLEHPESGLMQDHRHCSRRLGMTLVELLVLTAIAG